MVNRFIISLEIGAELIFIVSAVVHHLRWDHGDGFVYVRMYLFCCYVSHLCCKVLEITW
jgi:hypothetical protein